MFKQVLEKIFSTNIKTTRNGKILKKKFLVINILFFKIKIFKGYQLGTNNKVILVKDGKNIELKETDKIEGLNYSIEGNNNTIIISEPSNFIDSTIRILGDNNLVQIGKPKRSFISINILMLRGHSNRKLIIGDNFDIRGGELYFAGNNKTVKIGNDVMCSSNINFRTTDSHKIIDLSTNEQVNLDDGITIGNHVWIAKDVIISKGATIPDNCVIGTRAFVNKKFTQENCVIAGIPAKIVKTGVTWAE